MWWMGGGWKRNGKECGVEWEGDGGEEGEKGKGGKMRQMVVGEWEKARRRCISIVFVNQSHGHLGASSFGNRLSEAEFEL